MHLHGGHGYGHHADGACSGDENVFTNEIKEEQCVQRFQGVEDGGYIVSDGFIQFEYVDSGNAYVFGKAAGTVDAYTDGVATEVALACTTVTAVPAGNVTFSGNAIARASP